MSTAKMSCRLLVAGALLAAVPPRAGAGFTSSWEASSGLLPTQIGQPWTLVDTASPEDPVLGSQFLTISTSQDAENMFYIQSGSTVDTSGPFFMEARVRFASGSSATPSRAPISISFTTTPNVGNALFIGHDEVFFNTGDGNTKGPSASVDTDGAFHTYRIDVSATGALSLRYDGTLVLTGQTFTSAAFNGSTQRILWGEGSSFATGTSEWASFTHNALAAEFPAVPQPSSLFLFAVGVVGVVCGHRRFGR